MSVRGQTECCVHTVVCIKTLVYSEKLLYSYEIQWKWTYIDLDNNIL